MTKPSLIENLKMSNIHDKNEDECAPMVLPKSLKNIKLPEFNKSQLPQSPFIKRMVVDKVITDFNFLKKP